MMKQQVKILVVDDNDSIRQRLMTKLQSCGFDVICADSGQEAIQKFNNESFDMVLTDINMREINGNVLAQYIRNVTMDVPVIGITGGPWLAGEYFDTVIEKPFELKFLMDSIEYCFSGNLKRSEPYKVRSCNFRLDDYERAPQKQSIQNP